MKSLQQKIQILEGLLGTKDITSWEDGFITGLVERLEASKGQVLKLSDNQIEKLDQIYAKHFA